MAAIFKRATISALATALTLTLACSTASAASWNENFDGGVPADWTQVNNSDPLGTTSWFQGNPTVFNAFEGAANSYAAANFNSGDDVAAISTWLITPTHSYNNGDVLTFYTRTTDTSFWPDRLEVRFSTVGGTDVGHSADSVGTFQKQLLSINPNQDLFGYPEGWTKFTATIGGLSGPTNGALAFRYFVDDGGPAGDNSNFIGIDSVSVSAVPEPSTYLMMGLGLGALGLLRKRKAQA
ncbi:PEP-CTERM sorting domain-containing protein [Oxalobacteraceae bacterium]|nr:PEP-CTERM sorting domain-containing protein [Oxalobacteraceae bacterium]